MNADQPKIMVVDDDPAMLLSMADILEDAGYEVCGVKDGYQAVERAAQEHFALVFMDINMPGIDGVEAYRQLKEVSPDTVVIMITGYSVEALVEQALKEGAYTVLYKPLDVKLLMLSVKSVLDGPCVLVVDDEADSRDSVRMLLEDSGYEVAMAGNGDQAVTQVDQSHFDVVLMDVGMPGMDAFEACRRIVESDSKTKVIFVTAHNLEEYAKQALLAGAFSLMSKPVEPEDLVALVNSLAGSGDKGEFGRPPHPETVAHDDSARPRSRQPNR